MTLPNNLKTPAFVQMMQWVQNPFALMEKSAKRYGDCFTVKVGHNFRPWVFVHNPQALKEILTADPRQFDAPGEVNERFCALFGKRGVMTCSGDDHHRERQLLMPPFHGERMLGYGQLVNDITEQVINEWTIGKPFSTRPYMQRIALRVILHVVFGLKEEGERYKQLEQLLGSLLEKISSPLSASLLYFPFLQRDLGPLFLWGRILEKKQQIDSLLYAEIQERREQPDPSRIDILSLLMSARDQQGQPMTDVELHDELMTLLVAGHETTASVLAWALYWIHKLPQVRDKLLQELGSLSNVGDSSALIRLPYLNAVCAETLRIYPVSMITFPRVLKMPLQLMGYHLEPGTTLVGCIYLTHRRTDLYPQPERFKPERFLERQFSTYEYLPFGAGSRRCIGMAFAKFEMKVVLAKILSRYKLSLVNNRSIKPIRRSLVSAPSNVRMVATGFR